jgi:ribosome-binding factor A
MSFSRLEFSRADRIRKAIMKEVSDILRRELQDPRLTGTMISVTDVEVSGDLQHAKVFISIFKEDEAERKAALAALEELTPKVRHLIGQRIRMRFTPSIKFLMDDSLERGARITDILNKIRDGEA